MATKNTDKKAAAATAITATAPAPALPSDPLLSPAPTPMIPTRRGDPTVKGIEVPGAAQRIARRDAGAARQQVTQHLKNVGACHGQLARIVRDFDANPEVWAVEWAREGVSIDTVRAYAADLSELLEKFTAAQG